MTPEAAGWRYLSFRIATASYAASTGDEELALVPLVGRCRIEADGTTWELGGRSTVFEGMPWALYLPRDTEYRVEASGLLELAVSGARCEHRREPVLVKPDAVEIEVRGAGNNAADQPHPQAGVPS